MNIRIPKELIDFLDTVRGEKSRQAYLVNMLDEKFKTDNIIAYSLKSTSVSTKK